MDWCSGSDLVPAIPKANSSVSLAPSSSVTVRLRVWVVDVSLGLVNVLIFPVIRGTPSNDQRYSRFGMSFDESVDSLASKDQSELANRRTLSPLARVPSIRKEAIGFVLATMTSNSVLLLLPDASDTVRFIRYIPDSLRLRMNASSKNPAITFVSACEPEIFSIFHILLLRHWLWLYVSVFLAYYPLWWLLVIWPYGCSNVLFCFFY